MMELWRALRAEQIKLRRTLALWMVGIAPMLVVLFQIAVGLRNPDAVEEISWEMFASSAASLWAIFMLPLTVALQTALVNGVEHQNHGWKHVLALPVSRASVYTAKLLTSLGLMLLSAVVLWGGIGGAGLLLRALVPTGLTASVPWADLGLLLLPVHAAAMLVLAIHHWISYRWRSTTLALGTGIAGVFFAVFAAGKDLGAFYPWLQPARTLARNGAEMTPALVLGLGGGLLFAVLAGWEAVRRDVA